MKNAGIFLDVHSNPHPLSSLARNEESPAEKMISRDDRQAIPVTNDALNDRRPAVFFTADETLTNEL